MSAAADGGGSRGFRRIAIFGVLALVLLTGLLWARYGSIVFIEMLATAWAMCF
ncbi:MAG: hypothetical protein LCH61_07950 [Proteobacteria bacterium]|nr:hypothetical protein [Pseudomonadota bacterium]